jgi:large subunit ribosomal protein L7A
MLTQLENSAKVVGVKQVRRALASGRAKALFLARDADPSLTEPLAQQAQTQGVDVHWADTMKTLGRACRISVGAAVAATI